MSVILVVAAHPDDEILGAGATIARKVAEGNKAYALILGEGQTSRWKRRDQAPEQAVSALHNDSVKAAGIIGYSDIYFENLPDNRFDRIDLLDVVKLVEAYIDKVKPDMIYTHYGKDLNIDHRRTSEAVLTATRPVGNYSVKEIYEFETVSSTEWNFGCRDKAFSPNVFVEIDNFFRIKCEAMKCYRSELCEFPHPRSLKMLEFNAGKWGATVGKNYAEAFELVRKVE